MENHKKQDTWQRILDCAETLFAQQGYSRTTTREVAAAAGISNHTLHYHSGGKLELYRAVLQRSLLPVTEMLNRHVQTMIARDLNNEKVFREEIESVIDELFELMLRSPNYPQLFTRIWLETDPELKVLEWERLVTTLKSWEEQVKATVNPEYLQGMNLLLGFFSLGWMYWGMFLQPDFVGRLLEVNAGSESYLKQLKAQALEVTLRIFGQKRNVKIKNKQ